MSQDVLDLTRYEAAREALAEAVRVDEVQEVRDFGLRMRAYAKIAKDKRIQADAATLILRAERKLGVLIQSAKETGQLGIGRPSKSNVIGQEASEPDQSDGGEQKRSDAEQFSRVTLDEVGVDRKLSMRAQGWARLGDAEFEQTLQEVRDKIEASGATVVNPQKDLSTADKKKRRQTREAELGAKQRSLPERKFGVILTDDEWEHEPWSDAGLGKAAANHYPVSSLEDLKARDVGGLAAADCVYFMWSTVPHLAQAIELMAHRGFTYKTNCIWKKLYPGGSHGMGYWFWIDHEILLVGTRGNVPAPAPGTQWRSVIEAPVGEHSEKPAIFHEMIEEYFPSLPKIELNARRRRDGWECWGFEAPEDETKTAAPNTGASPAPGGAADGDAGSGPVANNSNTPEESGTAREAPGGQPLSGDGDIGGLKQGAQPAPRLSSVAADRVGRPAEGAGEGVPVGAGGPLPASLGPEAINQIIKAGYATDPFPGLDELARRCGLTPNAVQQRAKRMGLGSKDRQRQAVSEANRKREHAGVPAE
jgi:N6-adenosine-specific RNA methylase IME4